MVQAVYLGLPIYNGIWLLTKLMNFAISGLRLCVVLVALPRISSAAQDPSDPLVTARNMSGSSRLQFGKNILPADWSYAGKMAEAVTEDLSLPHFKIEYLSGPTASPGDTTEGFEEVPCEFFGTTPIVTVLAQNGERHKFSVDSGALGSFIRPSIAERLNYGTNAPFPMVLQCGRHIWVHFRVGVNPRIAILSSENSGFPADGILGMNAIACMQLKIDYRKRKLWIRTNSSPLESPLVQKELPSSTYAVTIPMTRQESGRYSIDTEVNGHPLPLEVDTGASIMGLGGRDATTLNLESVGTGDVLVEGGTRKLKRYLASSANLAGISFPWPIIHEAEMAESDIGGFGPSVLPHQTVIIDYPGLNLYTLRPNIDELVIQALGQLISGAVIFDNNGVLLDMPEVVGKSRAILTKIQNEPVGSVITTLRSWIAGQPEAKSKLMNLYRKLNSGGHLTIIQNGQTKLIETSQ